MSRKISRKKERKIRNFAGIFAAVFAWSVWLFCFSSYSALLGSGEERVFDYAGLFSQEEKEVLEEKAGELRKSLNAEFIVLTTEDANGHESQWVADEFYFSNGFSENFEEDGMLILIDMDNREIYLGSYGVLIRILTDQRLDAILDAVYAEAGKENYADAVIAGLNQAESYIQQGIVSGQYNLNTETGRISIYRSVRWYEALLAVAVSAGIAGIACFGVKQRYQMRSGSGRDSRFAYQENSSFHLNNHTDLLVNTVVHHTVIPKRTTNSTGSSSHHSSANQSSIHTHNGHQAGGKGRKF